MSTSGVYLVLAMGGLGSGSTKFRFVQANLRETSIFPGKLLKNFNFFQAIFKKFDFPGKNYSFTARPTFGQIFLVPFKNPPFRTNFLYIIRYNNISTAPLRPPRPPYPK